MNYHHIIFGETVPFVLKDYEPYMFNKRFHDSLCNEKLEKKENIENNNEQIATDEKIVEKPVNYIKKDTVTNSSTQPKVPTMYSPDRKESLFWCIYIVIHGFVQYEILHRNFTNVIISEKQKVAEHFCKNIKSMKSLNKKLTNNDVQNIISDMMTNQTMTVEMLYGFAILYKKQIYVVYSKTYIDISPDIHDENPIVILKTTEYSLETEPDIEKIKSNHFLINNRDKPLQSMSSYKIQELKDIAHLFDVDMSKKMDKSTLYNEINATIKNELC